MIETSLRIDMIVANEATTPLARTYYSQDPTLPVLTPEDMCIELHLDNIGTRSRRDYFNIERVRTALGQVAHYMALRSKVASFEHVVGVTHANVAQMAVKYFDFKPYPEIPLEYYHQDTIDILAEDYGGTPHFIFMESPAFTKAFKTGAPSPEVAVAASLHNLHDVSLSFNEEAPFLRPPPITYSDF